MTKLTLCQHSRQHRNTEKRLNGPYRFITMAMLLLLMSGCSAHSRGTIPPQHLGCPNQTIDHVVSSIREEQRQDDTMGSAKQQKFQVFMMNLPDEHGRVLEPGLITLSEGSQ